MTEFKKVFLDTAPLIYFLDADIKFGEKVKNIFEEILLSKRKFITSAVTCEEYLVYPYHTQNYEKINAFMEFINDCNIPICPIDIEIAQKAAQIRAYYKDFKAMDSLQLATACIQECDLFLTNDKQLRQCKDILCITVEEWQISLK